jgi:hypothetical protein
LRNFRWHKFFDTKRTIEILSRENIFDAEKQRILDAAMPKILAAKNAPLPFDFCLRSSISCDSRFNQLILLQIDIFHLLNLNLLFIKPQNQLV